MNEYARSVRKRLTDESLDGSKETKKFKRAACGNLNGNIIKFKLNALGLRYVNESLYFELFVGSPMHRWMCW